MVPRRCRSAVLAAVALVAPGCGDEKQAGPPAPSASSSSARSTTVPASGPATTTTNTTTTSAAPRRDPPRVRAVKVAAFDDALALALRPGDEAMYVAEKGGRVKTLRDGVVGSALVLDISAQVSDGNEQGLLGIAFSPEGERLYVDFTDTSGDTRVVEYAFSSGRADPASRRQILFVDQPFPNHNGGQLVFGPDGFLYIGLGDGGSAGDPQGNGQRLDTLLGKILRIDPRPDGTRAYAIPPGNPFAGRQGARPEIWVYGLRNPWRFTFDRETGDLWIGDVGQNAVEEVDTMAASAGGGQNFGWNRLEGTHHFAGSAPAGAVAPVHEYAHGDGTCSVTGGYVYRGTRIPGLRGSYVFADYCKGEVRALVAGRNALRSVALGPSLEAVGSFGQDSAGELYVMSLVSGLYRLEPAA